MNKICVYAICKNEIKFVDKWLDNMSEADYIVVLDTGSTDGTYEKLKSDPRVTKVKKKVISPWRFDVARNESMKLAPKDANILLCTDLDELFEPGWGDIIRKNWKEKTYRGFYTYVWSHTDAGNPGITYQYDKMHTRDFKWYYPVHEILGLNEGVEEPMEGERIMDFVGYIALHHYQDKTKSRSNYIDLLELRCDENPNEPNSMFLLGREYALYGNYFAAIDIFKKILNLSNIDNYHLIKMTTLLHLGDICSVMSDEASAIGYYSTALVEDPSYREPYVLLSEIFARRGDYEIAYGYLKEAFVEGKTYKHLDWVEKAEVWNEKVYDVLSVVQSHLGEYESAVSNALKALKMAPNNERIKNNYIQMLEQIDNNQRRS